METLALYLVKSAALMAMFLGAYHVFLKRETFFRSNRWYLLAGLATSIVLPLVTFKKVVFVEAPPVVFDEPAAPMQTLALSEVDAPVVAYTALPEPASEVNWTYVLLVVYASVALILAIQFIRDFISLRKLLKGKAIQLRSGYKFVDVPENVAPFSYFNYIVYNSTMFSHDELINILEHEKVHSLQKHTLDVLFSRIICILFWWNPVVWFYKKAIVQNLEFIADSEAAKRIPDIKAYQFTLLKITTHTNCVSITNHFFQSLIKKRIVMLNKNQSSKWNSYKYLLIVPALAAFMVYFQVKVIAQEKHSDALFFKGAQEGVEVVVDKNTTDAQLKQHAEALKKTHGIKLKFSKVKRNSAGEIVSIKAEFKDENGKKGSTMVSGDKAIEPIRFFKTANNIGFGNAGNGSWARNMRFNRNGDEKHFSISTANGDHVVAVGEPFEFDGDSSENRVLVRTIKNGKQQVVVNGNVVSDIQIGDGDDIETGTVEISTTKDEDGGGSIFINGQKVFSSDDVSNWAEFGLGEAEKALSEVDMREAREEIRQAMAEARRHRSESRLHRSEARLAAKKYSREDQLSQMEQMKAELEQTKAEIEKARVEIAKMQSDLKKERAATKKKK
ncbi:M56 family metallopeptidase [Flavobacterium selenitireducens]|uniref:M56 family metallopeptidase n=1 Tax=Flavobacterium selenitireducens TaxID=2722704 RepID=UPI00168C07A7|nr:M56 family metallopeptidase [Flavobacterium selenitireducens]MBD3581120.1 M56 family peptidase [Flavobacterium selenitireducens]